MTSAPITEIRAVLRRLLEVNGHKRADFSASLDVDGKLTVGLETYALDGSGGDTNREAWASVPDETDAERRAGHLACPRRVTLQMQQLEDAVSGRANGERT